MGAAKRGARRGKKPGRGRLRRTLLIALFVALAAVGALIALRLREYELGRDYYDSLRTGFGR